MDFNTLITDRTLDDVLLWNQLRRKNFSDMTPDEQQQFLSNLKGAYNYTDLNRVATAVEELTTMLQSERYDINTIIKKDWQIGNIPSFADLETLIDNVKLIKEKFDSFGATPIPPDNMYKLTFSEANIIEQVLLLVYQMINQTLADVVYSNEVNSGEFWWNRIPDKPMRIRLIPTSQANIFDTEMVDSPVFPGIELKKNNLLSDITANKVFHNNPPEDPTVDQSLSELNNTTTHVGDVIVTYHMKTVSEGFLICDGSSVDKNKYPELYALTQTLPNIKYAFIKAKEG
jgi:hypothetical protein